ncbi:hypothetical protein [Bradyrhizobium retamae]|uniref:hypothetical protein n=1 Tax=Bradyrhizobium retamae TaxID=1300035 RepID=UPI000A6AF86A|nr:hypothetical protein [Bradyrhizobium retamae]
MSTQGQQLGIDMANNFMLMTLFSRRNHQQKDRPKAVSLWHHVMVIIHFAKH